MKKLHLAVLAMSALSVPAFAQGTPPAGGPPGGAPPPMAQLPPVQKGKGPAKAEHFSKAMVMRGAELVRFGGCNTCHTPWTFNQELHAPAPDMSRMFSGHPDGAPDPSGSVGETDMALIGPTFTSFKMPWGTVYAANLTPDVDTGLGSWTEKMFIDAFRKGKHMGGNGRAILPPMPWSDVDSLSTNDLKAIFAFLRTVPPIHNAVPDPKVPPPVLEGMGHMNDALIKMMSMHGPKGMKSSKSKMMKPATKK